MAFYLKQSTTKKGIYLQIYKSFHDKKKKQTVSQSVKAIGYVHDLIEQGIEDPITYFKAEIDKLNKKREKQKILDSQRKITEHPIQNFGYFLMNAVMNTLDLDKYINFLNFDKEAPSELPNILKSLIYSRVVHPCSKKQTFEEVIPTLANLDYKFNLDNIYKSLDFLGLNYKKVVEIFNDKVKKNFGIDTSTLYFDATNFYFEIDLEDELRRDGPSKENKHSPIVSMGLLLDRNQIPIGMSIFPGNASEKPELPQIINDIKNRYGIEGRTVIVADKGLNTTNNILTALSNKDGYIFSQSVKKLSDVEKTWVLLNRDYKTVTKNGEVLYKYKSCIDEFPYKIQNKEGKFVQIKITQKRLVTFNPALARKKEAEINNLVDKAVNLSASEAKKKEYGAAAKYMKFKAVDKSGKDSNDKVIAVLNHDKVLQDKQLAGYNMIVTSEINMPDKEIYEAYHALWNIEESFKIMKSDVNARPVFLQKPNRIRGHFLICYLAVLIIRLLQNKVFGKTFNSNDLVKMIRNMKCTYENDRYINLTAANNNIVELNSLIKHKIDNYYLKENDLKKFMQMRVKHQI